MKLTQETQYPSVHSRVNKIVFVVMILWLVTSLLLLLYHPGAANAVQPRKTPQHKLAMAADHAAALASFIY
jgi:hypothetical protein